MRLGCWCDCLIERNELKNEPWKDLQNSLEFFSWLARISAQQTPFIRAKRRLFQLLLKEFEKKRNHKYWQIILKKKIDFTKLLFYYSPLPIESTGSNIWHLIKQWMTKLAFFESLWKNFSAGFSAHANFSIFLLRYNSFQIWAQSISVFRMGKFF